MFGESFDLSLRKSSKDSSEFEPSKRSLIETTASLGAKRNFPRSAGSSSSLRQFSKAARKTVRNLSWFEPAQRAFLTEEQAATVLRFVDAHVGVIGDENDAWPRLHVAVVGDIVVNPVRGLDPADEKYR